MNTITIKFDVTEYQVSPQVEHETIDFGIHENAVSINLFDDDNKSLMVSEICKKDAIDLAKLILMKYSVNL